MFCRGCSGRKTHHERHGDKDCIVQRIIYSSNQTAVEIFFQLKLLG